MGLNHIVKSYDEDLKYLNHQISHMGSLAINQLNEAIKSVLTHDVNLARDLIEEDPKIDQIEHDIEAFAIRMIALRQPVAKDLRNIISALKVSTHLERIADYATNIAKRSPSITGISEEPLKELPRMTEMASSMIHEVVASYIEGNDKQALKIWRRDQALDGMYIAYLHTLLEWMMDDPRHTSVYTQLLFLAKNIERIGDHTTNIAEMVYYLVRGVPFSESRPKGDMP
jgi:phosphate transport system protein